MLSKMLKDLGNPPLLLGFLAALIYELPFIILGENSHIYIDDNLGSIVSALLIMIRSGQLFSFHSIVEPIMNGLPREFLANGIKLRSFWYIFFEPFKAYLLNDFLVHLVAFSGMYLLIKQHLLKTSQSTLFISIAVSLAWSFIPFFSIYGLSIAGQPLLLFAFLNLSKNKQKALSYSIILLFPLYSMLVFVGVFIIAVVGVYFLWHWLIDKNFSKHILIGTIVLTFGYIVTEYHIIELVLFNKELISHRVDWNTLYLSSNLQGTLIVAVKNFIAGHFHARSIHILILLFSIATVIYLTIVNKASLKRNRIIILLSIVVLANLLYAFMDWDGLIPLKERIPLLKSFQINRLIWLTPLLWYIILTFTLDALATEWFARWLFPSFITFQLLFSLLYHSEIQFRTQLVYKNTGPQFSYKEFYSESLLKEIKKFIGKPQNSYRVISLGIQPAITQYSGFYTLDSYQNNYLLSYKKRFRKIIAKELDKNKEWRDYFDCWGNRCYLFSSEIKKDNKAFFISKNLNIKIKNLEINTNVLKAMGCEYLFSAVEIQNASKINLRLDKVFENKESPWRIYLYQLKE